MIEVSVKHANALIALAQKYQQLSTTVRPRDLDDAIRSLQRAVFTANEFHKCRSVRQWMATPGSTLC